MSKASKIPSNLKGKNAVGRWIRTSWDDCGVWDGICVAHRYNFVHRYSVFFPDSGIVEDAEESQLVSVGPRLGVPDF